MPKAKPRPPQLIVASARLPVTLSHRQGEWTVSESTGGLVTALKSVAERRPFTWLGWPGTHVPEDDRAAVKRTLAKHGAAAVFLRKADIEGFYGGFSNRVLWPLFHNLSDRSHFDRAAWRAYERANAMFADEIMRRAKPGDVVWVHDYQLALVPELLRRRGLTCPVGFFLHIPFPSAETYRSLPVRDEILRGMLGSDLIAFHTYEYVSHFRNACLRVLGVESEPKALRLPSHRVNLEVLPIGIDPAEVRDLSGSPEAALECATLRETYHGKSIVAGVDRLDYTKGIPQKLLAFEELLRAHPKLRDRVVFVQIAAPSRTGVIEYQELKREVDELVGRINGHYGTPTNTPVVYVNQNVSRARIVGLFQAADIAFITPVRDGMNLVALEYVAARGSRGGHLVLSEFAGAAHCLPGAKLVSPHNVLQMASTLAEAIEQRRPNMESFQHMLDFVNRNTSERWANSFLDRLEECAEDALVYAQPLRVDESPVADKIARANKPLVLLDYDGTLRPFVLEPRDAIPQAHAKRALTRLTEVATVYIISGRPGDTLDEWLGDLNLGFVCEHGFATKHAGGEWEERGRLGGHVLARTVEPILQDFVRKTPGSRIERKRTSLAWHYRAADPEYGAFQANELFAILEDTLKRRPYNVLKGARVIEVRHESATKGRATAALLKLHKKADFLFCAGDDRTDEEMMEAIPHTWDDRSVTCWVGMPNSRAQFWVPTSDALILALESMATTWGAPNSFPLRSRPSRPPSRHAGPRSTRPTR